MNFGLTFLLQFFIFFIPGLVKDDTYSNKSDETEVIIIGTVHESTPNFTADTLINFFIKVRPDLILLETDSSYFNSDFSLKEDIMYMSPETISITEYTKKHSVKLRPYDINGRDQFLDDPDRLNNQYGFFNDIESLNENGKFNKEAAAVYLKIKNMTELADELSNETLTYINSSDGSKKIDTINYYTYEGLKRLIEYTPELSKYSSYWNEECDYKDKRNNVMLKNILDISGEFKGNKIIVMCGFAHKNFLVKELTDKSGEYELEVKEPDDY